MKVVILKSGEARERYRFVADPLAESGHDIVLLDIRSISNVLLRVACFGLSGRRADVIVAIGAGPKILLVFWLARLLGIPFVLRLGGDPIRDAATLARSAWKAGKGAAWLKQVVAERTARLLVRAVDDLIVVNISLRAALAPFMRKGAQSWVIPQFSPGATHPRGHAISDAPVLLSVTNLKFASKAEGVLWLVQHLADYVIATGRSAVFRIAGGGGHLAEVRAGVGAMDIPESLRIEILGFVDDVEALYREADVFLYHSRQDGTPNVLLEARRCGVPMLVNDFPAFRSIVSDGDSGLIYSDPPTFKLCLDRLLSDQALRERLARNAQREHEESFTVAASRQRLEEALGSAVANRDRTRGR